MPTSPIVGKTELERALTTGLKVGDSGAGRRRVEASAVQVALRDAARRGNALKLHLENLRVVGPLDLCDFDVPFPLIAHSCQFESEVLADRATLHRIEILDCDAEHYSFEEVDAKHSILLSQVAAVKGGISLRGARVEGDIDLRGSSITTGDGSIVLDNAVVSGFIKAQSLRVVSRSPAAAISLSHARVECGVNLSLANLSNSAGAGLEARYSRVKGTFNCTGIVVSTSCKGPAVDLNRANIDGYLTLDSISLDNDIGSAVRAINAKIGQGLTIEGRSKVTGRGKQGALRVIGTEIDGQAIFSELSIKNERGPALVASGLKVGTGLFLHRMDVEASSHEQAIDLKGLECKNIVDIRQVTVDSKTGAGIALDQAQVDGSFLVTQLSIGARGRRGALRLIGARVRGQASFETCNFSNVDGPCIVGDGLDVGDDLVFAARTTFASDYLSGAIRLLGSNINGQFAFTDSRLNNKGGSGLNLQGMAVAGGFVIKNSNLESLNETVRFLSATCGGDFYIYQSTVKNPKGSGGVALILQGSTIKLALRVKLGELVSRSKPNKLLVDLENCTYSAMSTEDTTIETWLIVLRNHTTRFVGQPYQQLAKARRETGQIVDARRVLVQQEKDRREVGTNMSPLEKRWHRALGVLVDYGYRPQKALYAFLGVVFTVAAIVVGFSAVDPTLVTRPAGLARAECGLIEQLSFAGDIAIPIIGAGFRFQQCALTPSTVGQALIAVTTLLKFSSWAFVTLFVAGLTGLVKKIG